MTIGLRSSSTATSPAEQVRTEADIRAEYANRHSDAVRPALRPAQPGWFSEQGSPVTRLAQSCWRGILLGPNYIALVTLREPALQSADTVPA